MMTLLVFIVLMGAQANANNLSPDTIAIITAICLASDVNAILNWILKK